MTHKCLFSFFLGAILAFETSAASIDSLKASLDTLQGEKKVKALNELFREKLHGDPVTALSYAREALSLATEIDDAKGMAAAYNNLGVAYRNQGALDKALEYYINSMKIYEKLDNKEGIATTKNNIANIYSIKKDYAQAMRNLEESYTIFVQMKDEAKLVGSMNNLGNLYSDMQLFEKAQKYYSEAYQLSEKIGDKFSDPLSNLANLYFKQSNFDKAIEYYLEALKIQEEQNNRLGLLNTVTNLGIAYAKARQTRQAEFYLNQAKQLTDELQAYTSLPSVYKAMAENFYNQGKMKDAYEMQLKYDEERERIYGEESSRNIAQMEMVLDFEEKERQFEILKREAEINSLELKYNRLIILLVILGVIIIIAGVNLYYLDRRKKLVGSSN